MQPRALHLVLFEPDIPQNAGSCMRLAACLDLTLHIIEPCGFPIDDRRLRRAGMDYIDHLRLIRHSSWSRFAAERPEGRLIALSRHASTLHTTFRFQPGDQLLMGRESGGLPDDVTAAADCRIRIPLKAGVRSLNLAQAAAIAASAALTDIDGWPHDN